MLMGEWGISLAGLRPVTRPARDPSPVPRVVCVLSLLPLQTIKSLRIHKENYKGNPYGITKDILKESQRKSLRNYKGNPQGLTKEILKDLQREFLRIYKGNP